MFYDDELNSPSTMMNPELGTPAPILRTGEEIVVEPPEDRKAKFVTYAKRILPHVGLVILLIFYLLLGGTYFYYIESAFEGRPSESPLTSSEKPKL